MKELNMMSEIEEANWAEQMKITEELQREMEWLKKKINKQTRVLETLMIEGEDAALNLMRELETEDE